MTNMDEEYLLKWNSHNSELIAEFHDLCRVTSKFKCMLHSLLFHHDGFEVMIYEFSADFGEKGILSNYIYTSLK
jgi:hypothetical protein